MCANLCNVDFLYTEFNHILNEFLSKEDGFKTFYSFTNKIQSCLKGGISFRDLRSDGDIYVHLLNVSILCGKIGTLCNLSDDTLNDLMLGGLLHDIGKFYLPKDILYIPGKLTKFQRIAISSHTHIGKDIVSLFTDNEIVISMIKGHHKIINSLKNPIILSKQELSKEIVFPLICGIADITDAITSKRSYKEPLPTSVARNDLLRKGILDIDTIFSDLLA